MPVGLFVINVKGVIIMTKFNHLNKDERDTIQYMIDKGHNYTSISNAIKKDRTTISKEIKRNRYIKSNINEFSILHINKAVDDCQMLQKILVCNHCQNKAYCSKRKLYYNSKMAQKHYEDSLINTRTGINISKQEIDEIEHSIIPLIKNKNQSINQVYASHKDILYFSIPTFYKYIDLGVLSLSNLDLPKKVKYKQRKNKQERQNKRALSLLIGRSYDDYLKYISNNPKVIKTQMDTVIGLQENSKCLLTIIISETNFMFIRLLDKKNIESVNKAIDSLKSTLGIELYSKLFQCLLTDNGSEFFDPLHIEINYDTGEKIANLFYCKPYSSWQKGCIEKNHEFIRKVFPKGTSFSDFNDSIIKKLETNINNVSRKKLGNKSPFELTKELYPDLIDKLNYQYIESDDITLNINDYIN